MCDYSLHNVASRPAKVADKLVSTNFIGTITRGFAEVGEPNVAVCLLPGTEIAFDRDVNYYDPVSFPTVLTRPARSEPQDAGTAAPVTRIE